MGLQREAAGLQEAMRRAVEGQQPLSQRDLDMLRTSDGSPDPAQAGMLLLKTRIFLKTMRELEQKSALLLERLDAAQAAEAAVRSDSLAASRTMLLQLQVQAHALAAAYGELESALQEAGLAAKEARQIGLLRAAEEARKRIREAEEAL